MYVYIICKHILVFYFLPIIFIVSKYKFDVLHHVLKHNCILYYYYYYYFTDDLTVENDDPKSFLERLIYLERQEYTSQMCQLFKLPKTNENYEQAINDTVLLDHILVDNRHKLLYCYVPKVNYELCAHVFTCVLPFCFNQNNIIN